MTLPALLFGLLIAGLIGSAFHLLRGGNGWAILSSLFLGILGFTVGQLGGMYFGFSLFTFGYLDIGLGVIGSLLFLAGNDLYTTWRARNGSSV